MSGEAWRELQDVRSKQEREFGSSHMDTIISTSRLAQALAKEDAVASRREYARAVKDVSELKTWRGVSDPSADSRLIKLLDEAESAAQVPLPWSCCRCLGAGDTSAMLAAINKTRYPAAKTK